MPLTTPVAYQVNLEPGIGQFRAFVSPQLRTRIYFRGTFSCALIDLREARGREVATLDVKSTISGCQTLFTNNNKSNNRKRGKGMTPM